MAQAGFLDQKSVRPGAAALVVTLHGAALAALLMIKNPEVLEHTFGRTKVVNILPDEPPPPPPPPRTDEPLVQDTRFTTVPLPTPLPSPFPVPPSPPLPPPDPGATSGSRPTEGTPYTPPSPPPSPPPARIDPPRAAVRLAAMLISGDLQPPYPAAEQRMEREGRVVIRVTIGPDGRVRSAQKVSATSDAFYQATERHARARWRFRPATVDGEAVETTKTMTVVFELDG